MKKGLMRFDWNAIEDYSDEDITYFLFSEGKSIDAICRIRNMDRTTVQNHIIEGKIKYRFLAKSNNTKEFFDAIKLARKRDKLEVLNSIDEGNKKRLIQFIRNNYADMYPKDKEAAVWILGELKDIESIDIILKASVNKFVNIRRMAVSAMGKIGSNKCEIALIRALDDENSQVVMYAIKALEKIKSIKAKSKIEHIKNTTEKSYLKRASEKYFESISTLLP
ncbi:HEAT repeat domain-containing protein [Clostridium colicanis]|uniref:PBS lyase HEAT-like repeat protein n=1 Tax=Clostridium colicanis DSM 13634 TaxID=1121305 RepID=A0A151ARC2_9CLOT|nr:HEAT repeat domain-containing protein [Clostridium colicanis]KYH30123.1 PBS lyase HEAT-like repeat protein [Clostridium colicanis DSM 13634]